MGWLCAPGELTGQLHRDQLDLIFPLRRRVGHRVARLTSGKSLSQWTASGQRLGLAADRSLFDDGDHVHRDDFTVREPQGHLGTTGQHFRIFGVARPGPQPPIQFIDSVTENDQFVSALYCLGGVSVITDHSAVVLDLDLQAITPLPQAAQLSGEVLPRCSRH